MRIDAPLAAAALEIVLGRFGRICQNCTVYRSELNRNAVRSQADYLSLAVNLKRDQAAPSGHEAAIESNPEMVTGDLVLDVNLICASSFKLNGLKA